MNKIKSIISPPIKNSSKYRKHFWSQHHKNAMIEEEKKEENDGLGRHSSDISILGTIGLYQSLLYKGKIKRSGTAYVRLNELKIRYANGEKYFAEDT